MPTHISSVLLPSCTVSKKLEIKQEKRLAEERRRQEQHKAARKRNLFTLVVVALVAALVVWLILSERNKQNPGSTFGADETSANCTEIEEHPEGDANHVEADVTYETQPPSSGDHFAQTADIGFHTADEDVVEENAVHNLEHGQIVAWYNSDAPPEVLDQLETYVDGAGIGMLALPYDQVPAGYNFSMSAWGATQSCEEVSGAVIGKFREAYQGKGPEQVGIPTYQEE